jgi:hypothetical protein
VHLSSNLCDVCGSEFAREYRWAGQTCSSFDHVLRFLTLSPSVFSFLKPHSGYGLLRYSSSTEALSTSLRWQPSSRGS